jgi:hypothetical protein
MKQEEQEKVLISRYPPADDERDKKIFAIAEEKAYDG